MKFTYSEDSSTHLFFTGYRLVPTFLFIFFFKKNTSSLLSNFCKFYPFIYRHNASFYNPLFCRWSGCYKSDGIICRLSTTKSTRCAPARPKYSRNRKHLLRPHGCSGSLPDLQKCRIKLFLRKSYYLILHNHVDSL